MYPRRRRSALFNRGRSRFSFFIFIRRSETNKSDTVPDYSNPDWVSLPECTKPLVQNWGGEWDGHKD